jgi:uncharacterized membrane protein
MAVGWSNKETMKTEPSGPLGPPPPGTLPPAITRASRFRTYFLTGVVVAMPLAITIYISLWFISLVDGWVKPLIPRVYLPESYLPFTIPGFGVVVAIISLTLLGFLTANLVGKSVIRWGETLLDRMPVVRGLYKAVKQIFETIFSQSGDSFRKVGLVQYPQPGQWSIVFISAPPGNEIAPSLPGEDDYLSVFLPCTPNPTTGFYFFIKRSEVIELPITVDEGAKLVMSAGMIQPNDIKKPEAAEGSPDRVARAS